MNSIKITAEKAEMISIGKELFEENSRVYNERMLSIIRKTIDANMPNATDAEKEDKFYQSIYDYWVYGNNIAEEFYFHFDNMSHEEKCEYVTYRNQQLYIYHLNKKEDSVLLNDKFKTYNLFQPYYKREVIQICSEDDFEMFESFITRHPVFVAKPAALGLAIGVHKVDSNDYPDKKELFTDLLHEGVAMHEGHTWRGSNAVVLEEIIKQHEELAAIHPESVNGIRVTTVRMGDKVHIVHPWFKIGANGNFVTSAAQGTMDAGIDPETGIVDTWGYKENGDKMEYHPQTGIRIPGYKIPRWKELIEMATEVALKLDTINYVGWDFVLTPDNGWCIMEGNFAGEFMWQMTYEKGMKKEFEELIGWKPSVDFWWQSNK